MFVQDCPNFLKNIKKKEKMFMKIFFSKCPKFVWVPVIILANCSATSIKERLSKILVCAFKTDKELYLFRPIVDLSQVLVLLCIEKKKPLSVADIASLVSAIHVMVQIVFIIGRFSSSISWKVLQISQKLIDICFLKVAGIR